jgi:phage-related protein
MELFKMFGEVALKGSKAVLARLKLIDQAAEELDRKIIDIRDYLKIEVDADTAAAQKQLEDVEDKVEDIPNRKTVNIHANTSGFMGTIMALGPAIVPVLASATVSVGGLTAAFAAAGAGAAAFGAVAIPALNGVFDASKEVEKIQKKIAEADTAKERKKAMKELQAVYSGLTQQERAALDALQDFKSFWGGFVKSLQNPVLDMFVKGLNTLKGTLTTLRPVFQASISAVSGLFDGMNHALQGQQIKKFFDWLAVNVGPAITTFGTAFGNVMTGIINLIMAFGPVSQDMQSGLVGLTQRFAEWSAGLANSQGFKNFIAYAQQNGPKLMTILGQVVDIIGQLVVSMAPLGPVVLDIITKLLSFVQWLLQLHPAAGMVLVGLFQLVGVFKLVSGGVTGLIGGFNTLKGGLTKIGPLFKTIGTTISSLASGALRMLVAGFRGLISVFNLLRVAMMTNPFTAIITAVIILAAIIIMNWSKIRAFLLPLWNSLKSAAANAWNAIKSGVSSAVSAVTQFIKSAWNSAKAKVSSIWNGMKSTASSVFNSIKSAISSAMNAVKSTITSIWNGVKSATTSVWNTIKSTISNGIRSAYNTVKGYVSSFLSAGKGLMSALAKGISSGLSKAISAVKSGMEKIRSYLPFSPAKEGPLSDLDKSGESFFPTFASRMDRGLSPLLRAVSDGMEETAGLLSPPSKGGLVASFAGAGSSGAMVGAMATAPIVHFHGPVYMRSEEDIALLAQKIEEERYRQEMRRARAQGRRG